MKNKMMNLIHNVQKGAGKLYSEAKKHLVEFGAAIVAMIPASTVNALATSVQVGTVSNSEAEALVSNVLGVIFTIFRYIGILLLAWSIGMLVLAFKNEDADSKSRAIMMMVVSVILISVKTLFTGLGITF